MFEGCLKNANNLRKKIDGDKTDSRDSGRPEDRRGTGNQNRYVF